MRRFNQGNIQQQIFHSSWKYAPLKYFVDKNDGGVWGGEPTGFQDTIVLRSTEQSAEGYWKINNPAYRSLSSHEVAGALLEVDDLLITKSSGSSLHIGKTTLVTPEVAKLKCCFSNFMQRIRVKDGLNSKFVWYLLNSEFVRKQFDMLSTSSTGLANLNGTMIGQVLIPILAQSHQTYLVEFLDSKTFRINTLIAKKTRFIELLKEKRQAIITKAVTKGLDDSVEMKDSGVEWVGQTPAAWEVKRLRWSVIGCVNGIWGNEPDGSSDVVVIRVADFDRDRRSVSLGNPTKRSITSSEREGRLLKKGDLLIEKSGGGDNQPVGMVVIYEHDEEAVCSNFVAKMTPANGYDPHYLKFLHQTFYQTRLPIRSIKQSTGIQNLDSKSYLDEYASFPPYEEQTRISKWLMEATCRIDDLISKTERSIELLKEKRSALITAAVTGKIDVREAVA